MILVCDVCVARVQLPYHNYLHAADVLLAANKLILHLDSELSVPYLDFLALQVACIGAWGAGSDTSCNSLLPICNS